MSWTQQREVLRRARRRQVHPDPVIRDAAHRWACEVRSLPRWSVAMGGLFDSGTSWAERRAARKILRAEDTDRQGRQRRGPRV